MSHVVADADVKVADSGKGISLTFTTKGDVTDLQARVERMAQMYEMHQGQSSMMWHQMGSGNGAMGDGKSGPGRLGSRDGMAMGTGNGMAMGNGMGMADGTGHMGAAEPMADAKAKVQKTDKGARVF